MNKCPYDMQFGIHWNYSRKCQECKLWKACNEKFKEIFGIEDNKDDSKN